MYKAILILSATLLLNYTSFSQQVKDDLVKGKSSSCAHLVIVPTVGNALKLITSSFSAFESLMSKNNYIYNTTEGNYWADNGPSGCNFYVINKKYDNVSFFWTGDKNLLFKIFDEFRINKMNLSSQGNTQRGKINYEGRNYEISIQDLNNGSGGMTFFEKGLATSNDYNFEEVTKSKISYEPKGEDIVKSTNNSEIINNWLFKNLNSDYKISLNALKNLKFKTFSNYSDIIPETIKRVFTNEYEPLQGLTPKVEVSKLSITLQFPLSCLCKFFLLEDKIIYTSSGCGSSALTQIYEFSTKKLKTSPYTIFKITNGIADITKDWFGKQGGHYYRNGKLNLITSKIVWGKVE